MQKSNQKNVRNIDYIIVAAPRTGSTYFCELLTKNGILKAGSYPSHYELLRPETVQKGVELEDFVQQCSNCFERSRMEKIIEGETFNFSGFKVLTFHFRAYLNRAQGSCLEDVLKPILGDRKIIVLNRKDYSAVRQSFVVAEHTGIWRHKKSKTVVIPDAERERLMSAFDEKYQNVHIPVMDYISKQPDALYIDYEELVASPEDVLGSVWSFLGVEKPKTWALKTFNKKYQTRLLPTSSDTGLFVERIRLYIQSKIKRLRGKA